MGRLRPVALQTFVYRTLALRLVAMAVFIGMITAASVHILEGQNLSNIVVEEARTEVQLLVLRAVQIIREGAADQNAAFRQALDERTAVQLRRENGSFVYVSFHGQKTTYLEERRDNGYPLIAEVLDFIRLHPFSGGETDKKAEVVTLAGNMHIHVVLPLEYQGQNLGSAQAIFAPSKAVLTDMERKLKRSVVLTIMIVLVTSALLYPVILHLVRKLVVFSRDLLEANLDALSLLASAIAKRDSDTDVHNFRVTLYSVRLAEKLKLSNDEIQTLIKGAFLHDVGKIGVRDNILLKAGKLDDEEFSQMKDHVRHGLDIVGSSVWLHDATQVVGSHHEKYDGSGYPEGKVGEEIPLLARIFAIADVFDALTSSRPYKGSLSYEESICLLEKGWGSHFDPKILDAFIGISKKLHADYSGRNDQGLRDELKIVISQYFSRGEILLY